MGIWKRILGRMNLTIIPSMFTAFVHYLTVNTRTTWWNGIEMMVHGGKKPKPKLAIIQVITLTPLLMNLNVFLILSISPTLR